MVWKRGKGYYLVNWKSIHLPGGFGVRNMKIHKMKWLWRYVEEDQALWRERSYNASMAKTINSALMRLPHYMESQLGEE